MRGSSPNASATPASDPAPVVCERCKLSSTLAKAFRLDKSTKPGKTVCPKCMHESAIEMGRRSGWHLCIWMAIGAGLALTNGHPWLAANIALCLPLALVVIVCHELGHATVAALLDFEVCSIAIGSGPRLFDRHWLGFKWIVRRHPLGGRVTPAARSGRLVVARYIALTFAGPAANVALAVTGWWVLRHSGYTEHPYEGLAPLGAFVAINALLGIVNLVPFTTREGGSSDGRIILLAVLSPAKHRRAYLEVGDQLRYLELRGREEKRPEATALAVAAAARFPDGIAGAALLGLDRLDNGRLREAREQFDALLARADEPFARAMLQNNVAYVALLSTEPDELTRGAGLATQAYAALPWMPAVAGTYAAYRILEGRPADAIAAVEPLLGLEMSDADRKVTLLTLALAHERAGNSERGAAIRREAARLAGAVPLDLERIVLPAPAPAAQPDERTLGAQPA